MNEPAQIVEVRALGVGAAAERLVQVATAQGYAVGASGPNRFRLARLYRPKWANVMALVLAPLFGLGLFFLLVKRTSACEATLVEDRTGVSVSVSGSSDPWLLDELRRALNSETEVPAPVAVPTAFAPQLVPHPPSAFSFEMPTLLDAPDADKTVTVAQLSAMRAAAVASLRFADGRSIPVGHGLVVGRNPEVDALLPGAQLFAVDDPSLSKTHATFGPAGQGVWVRDHHSTNGTTVMLNGSTTPCQPGSRVDVPAGGTVVIGEVQITVTGAGG